MKLSSRKTCFVLASLLIAGITVIPSAWAQAPAAAQEAPSVVVDAPVLPDTSVSADMPEELAPVTVDADELNKPEEGLLQDPAAAKAPASKAAVTVPPVPAVPVAPVTAVAPVQKNEALEPLDAAPVKTAEPAPKSAAQKAVAAASGTAAAEQAIIENAAALDSMTAPVAKNAKNPAPLPSVKGKIENAAGMGPTVTDILENGADAALPPARYLVVKKDHDEDDFDSRLTTARTALAHGRTESALGMFNSLYESNPDDKRVLMGRAVAMQKSGQNTEALAAYEAVLGNDPKNIEALTNMLGILKVQDPASALDKLLQLQEVYPYNADVAAQLGMAYGTSGDYPKALKYLEMADTLKPSNMGVLYNKAVVYDRMGRTQQAADLYRQVLQLADSSAPDQGAPIETIKKRLTTIH